MIQEIFKAILYFFLNPMLYLFIILLILQGVQRVRRERRSFGVKVGSVAAHTAQAVIPSLLLGLLLSAGLTVLGIAVPPGFLILTGVIYLVSLLTFQFRYVSPTIAMGLSVVIMIFWPEGTLPWPGLNGWIDSIRAGEPIDAAVLLVALALTEAVLILFWGKRQTSPRLISSKRGKPVGAHEVSQFWIVPVFMLMTAPGDVHSAGWWPLTGYTGVSFVLFPAAVGFQHFISHDLPQRAVARGASWLLLTGFAAGLLTGAWYFIPSKWWLAGAALLILVSKFLLIARQFHLHKNRPFYFSQQTSGMKVVDVIPGTAADRMGITMGETIKAVNGIPVSTEKNFYEAIQKNAAFCKLEIINVYGEIRLSRATIYEDDYHKIGLLFIEPSRRSRPVKGLETAAVTDN